MARSDKALVKAPSSAVADISDQELAVLRDALNPDLNPTELRLFGLVAKRSGLDPFAKQIYAIKRQGKVKFQTSIDGYRSIAERTGDYDGQDEPVFSGPCACGQEPKGHPESATVAVYRKSMGRPIKATAFWHEYKPAPGTRPDGKPGDGDVMWRKMPRVMLAKVAEANALRKAFPYVMADVYTAEEMEQADGHQPASAPALVGNADPTEAGQEESAVSGDGTSAADSPPPPDEGPDAYEGSVITPLPDRVREVKRPEWLHTLPPEATVAKTELKMTVGRSKHTAILLGDWAYAVQAANLTEGDTVRVKGERVEVVWQEGMPTKKEIRFVTRVEVLRDGGWQLLTSPQTTLDEVTSVPEDIKGDGKPVTGEAIAKREAEVVEGDFRDAAEEIFAGDVKPPTVEELLTLPPAKGEQDEPVDVTLMLLTLEAKTAGSGREYVQVKATDKENVYSGIMEKAEADAQLGPGLDNYAQGEVVRLIGTWVVTVKGPVILLTAVTAG